MNFSQKQNTHLRALLNEINLYGFNEELYLRLTRELCFSTLITPGFILTREDGARVIVLYTDLVEFYNSELIKPEFEPFSYFFLDSLDILDDENISGIVVNPDNEDFFIDKNLIMWFKSEFEKIRPIEDDSIPWNAIELKNIFDNVSNESLVEFIEDKENFHRFKLIMELHESIVCTLIYYDNIERNPQNIYPVYGERGTFATQYDAEGNAWALLLANKNAFYKTILNANDMSICYAHLVDFDKFVRYVLLNDMEGIALTNGNSTIQIPRFFLLEAMDIIKVMCTNNKLKNSTFYALL